MTLRRAIVSLSRHQSVARGKSPSAPRSLTGARGTIAGALLAACVFWTSAAVAETYYPPPESQGGWRTFVTKNAVPTADQKAAVLNATGLDIDHLVDAGKYCAFMRTRDFARFGYLMLHHGAWDNGNGLQQLVRPDLIANCTRWPKFLMDVTDGPGNNTQWLTAHDPPSHFLHTWHGWWVNWSPDWPSSLRPVWPSVPQDAFWMSGYGKDICVVIPSLDMVIAHQTARVGGLEQALGDRPESFSTLLSKVMAAVVRPPGNLSAEETTATVERWDTYERSFRAAGSHANPFQDVPLNPSWHEFAVHPSYFTLLRDWPFAGWTDFILKQVQMGSIGAPPVTTTPGNRAPPLTCCSHSDKP